MQITKNDSLPLVITEEMKTEIMGALKEMSGSLLRTEAEADLRKNIASDINEKFDVSKRDFNKLAKLFHKSEVEEVAKRNEEFMEFADAILS